MKGRGANDWLSILTNLGVIVGLVLVAYEVRQATMQANAEASHAMTTELQIARKELALSPDLAEIYANANANGVEALTPVQIFRMTEWENARKARIIGQIIQFRKGFLDRGAMLSMVPVLNDLETGLWADLGITPVSSGIAEVIEPIREELRLRDQ